MTLEHLLSGFAVDPRACIVEPEEDDWPILSSILKTSFGRGKDTMEAAVPEMLNCGDYGIMIFVRFFVVERSLGGEMFETKVNAPIKELKTSLVSIFYYEF